MKIFGKSKPLLEVGKDLHSTTMNVIWVAMVMIVLRGSRMLRTGHQFLKVYNEHVYIDHPDSVPFILIYR